MKNSQTRALQPRWATVASRPAMLGPHPGRFSTRAAPTWRMWILLLMLTAAVATVRPSKAQHKAGNSSCSHRSLGLSNNRVQSAWRFSNTQHCQQELSRFVDLSERQLLTNVVLRPTGDVPDSQASRPDVPAGSVWASPDYPGYDMPYPGYPADYWAERRLPKGVSHLIHAATALVLRLSLSPQTTGSL